MTTKVTSLATERLTLRKLGLSADTKEKA